MRPDPIVLEMKRIPWWRRRKEMRRLRLDGEIAHMRWQIALMRGHRRIPTTEIDAWEKRIAECRSTIKAHDVEFRMGSRKWPDESIIALAEWLEANHSKETR